MMALDELENLPSAPKNQIGKKVTLHKEQKKEDEDEKELKKIMNAA